MKNKKKEEEESETSSENEMKMEWSVCVRVDMYEVEHSIPKTDTLTEI